MGDDRDHAGAKAAGAGCVVVNARLTIKIELHFPAKSIFRTFR